MSLIPHHTGPTAEYQRKLVRAAELAADAPVPAIVGRVRTGTAGWTDPSLVKSRLFYPRGCSSAEDRLRFYATQFAMVEVDASYYALPTPANAERWVARTPDGFTFDVKAFAALTEHPVDVIRLPRDLQTELPDRLIDRGRVYPKDLPGALVFEIWKRFREAIEPLHAAGRLGCVLLQFPPWFTATRAHAKTLEVCRARMAGLPLAVEFRHASWGEPSRFERVVALLREHAMSYVVVDEPQGLPNSMPPRVDVADTRLAVVRFHGQRAETWAQPGATVREKFDWLYTPQELAPWVAKVRALGDRAEAVHAVFNNCVSNHAVLGAKDLAALVAHDEAAQRAHAAGG